LCHWRIAANGTGTLAICEAIALDPLIAKLRQSQPFKSFNDRYTGVEAFERAYAVYRQAAENDDVEGMLRERSTFLKELEVAEDRKKLLTQQSAQIENKQQRLSDIAASIQHEDLVAFVDRQTQDAIDKLRIELEQLSQVAPAKRGDITANLGTLESRVNNIDTELNSARDRKKLLTQQSAQIGNYQQRLSNIAASVQHEGFSGLP
jgi:hypothetical protein